MENRSLMEIQVDGISGSAYLVTIGDHELVVDQPIENGGEDLGPTPTDLFVAGLASCATFYAGRFLARHGVAAETVRATCHYRMSSERPARVESIQLTLNLPEGVSDEVGAGALRSAEHCTVHNSLAQPPEVRLSLGLTKAAA